MDRVLVVSPHLDDAGLSLADQLRHLPTDVLTVFSHADENTDVTWAHTCGFPDAFTEYEARRAEDKAAMAAIGIPYAYAGLAYGDLTAISAARMLDALQARIADVPSLTLLPLGAGGVSGGFDRLLRRVLRRPFGSPQHPDHIWVRDHIRTTLAGPVGYYAEIPYHWSNSQTALARMAADLIPGQVGRVTHGVDVDFKHATSCLYASQVTVELGPDPAYQRKVCAADEIVFLPL